MTAPHDQGASTGQLLKVLLVEDEPMQAELLVRELRKAGYVLDSRRVDNEREYLEALDPSLDVILADYSMPGFGAPRALALLKDRKWDVPFIVVSGSITEETAVEVLRLGAADYLLKDRLVRLPQAVQRAIDERQAARARRRTEQALRATEERMRFALEACRVGVWEVDLVTDVRTWSDTQEVLHGLAPGTFAGTRAAFLATVHPDDRDKTLDALERRARGQADFSVVYRTRWPDRSVHWISSVGRTTYDETGRPVRAAGICLDITERVVLEEQYRQAHKMEAIGQLAGGVAHDFNNILTAIEGYYDLVREQLPADHPAQPDLLEIHYAAERAVSLTRQLLAFGRRQLIEPRVLDLRESVAAIRPMLQRLIGASIKIVVRARAVEGRVCADPGQIEQIVLNLVVNARDAMPDGGTVAIEVEDAYVDEETARQHATLTAGHFVVLAVSDSGCGIDAETRARIFEPFFTTKEKGKGTGLGLSTVYGIVKQSGGGIWVYSEVGQGTTFKVYLPRVDGAVDAAVPSGLPEALAGSERVLVVEDDVAVRELVSRSLERLGYRVMLAVSPREAISLSARASGPIHLLLSDVILPDMSGATMASAIQRRHPGIKVLYMSGYSDEAVVQHGVLDEGVPFLQKPFSPQALARKIREVLG